jgi:hypothetical protein
MSLNPSITILKVLMYAIVVAILVIVLYGYLGDMATNSGGKTIKGEIEMTEDGERKPSW